MNARTMIAVYAAFLLLLGSAASSNPKANKYPEFLTFQMAAYPNSPVFALKVLVNGKRFHGFSRAVSTGWKYAGDRALYGSTMPYDKDDRDTVIISAKWVELFSQRGWTSQITLPLDDINTLVMGITQKSIIVGFGYNGELTIHSEYSTDQPYKVTVKEITYACGQRAPELDYDYEQDIGKTFVSKLHTHKTLIHKNDFRGRGMEPLATRCPDPEE